MNHFNLSKKVFVLMFVVSSTSMAVSDLINSPWVNPPNRGITVEIDPPQNPAIKSGTSTQITGKIRFKKSNGISSKPKDESPSDSVPGQIKKEDLLSQFKEAGFEIRATFPSSIIDVTPYLLLESQSQDVISFSFDTPVVQAQDPNQFGIQVLATSNEVELYKNLSRTKEKLEKRIRALELRISVGDLDKQVVLQLKKSQDRLASIVRKISDKFNQFPSLVASSERALQVDNITSAESSATTTMHKTRSVIKAIPGAVIEGMNSDILMSFVSLRGSGDANETEMRVVRLYHDGTMVFQSEPLNFVGGAKLEISKTISKLSPSVPHEFRAELYEWDPSTNQILEKKAYVVLKIPTAGDLVNPEWLSDGAPFQQLHYVKNLSLIDLKANDPFGRIDPASFTLNIKATLFDGSALDSDLSHKVTSSITNDGANAHFTGDINPLAEGSYTFTAKVSDLAGNAVKPGPWGSTFVIDRTAPVINFGLADGLLTRDSQHLVHVAVLDRSPVWTTIILNGQSYLADVAENSFDFVLDLKEGLNTIEVQSTDVAGNSSIHKLNSIFVDTTPPVLSDILPVDGTTFSVVTFEVSGKSNEKLKTITVNDVPWSLNADQMEFSGPYESSFEGPVDLVIEAEDFAGNIASKTISVVVSLKPLNANLIQVTPLPDESRLIVRGAPGTTKPGFKVTVAGSFFNYESTEAAQNGSFEVILDPFTEASVSVVDPATGKKYSATISYGSLSDVLLAGKVMSSSGDVLPNVSVSIAGTNISTTTDVTGAFVFSRAVIQKAITGDQILVVNAANAILPAEKSQFKFGMTKVAISLGLTQKNVLLRPIYLTPLITDGSETIIQANSGGTITSPHAPGAQLVIPPGVTQFPNGVSSSAISMTTISSEFTTIPPVSYAMPKEVVALEPSGTTFSAPIEIILPNSNELSPGTDLVILLMNSKTGRWEIGGAAQVTADGQSVRSKPGLGIKHFSAAYATPLGPMALERKSSDKRGADVFNGSMQTLIQMPSFKTLGQEVTPSLIYKSSWAKPTAMVSNLLDLPDRELEISEAPTSGVAVQALPFSVKYCTQIPIPPLSFIPHCQTKSEEYYRAVEYEDHITKNRIFTDKVTGQFSFLNSQSEKLEFTGTPQRATLSYSVNLKNLSDEFVPSGIYPYSSHYEVHLKQQVLGTRKITRVTGLSGGSAQMNDAIDIDLESKLDPIFPPDLAGQIYVQNKIDSEAGQGWRITGAQKIINPTDDKIMLEEADGTVTTYSVENTIETLFNASQKGADLTGGVGLNQWPLLLIKDKTQNKIIKFDLTQANPTALASYAMLPSLSGQIAGYQFNQIDEVTKVPRQVCVERYSWPGGNVCVRYVTEYDTYHNYKSICDSEAYNFNVSPLPFELLLSPEGLIYGSDSRMNALFTASDSNANRVAGLTRTPPVFGTSGWNLPTYNPGAKINSYCSERSLSCQLASRMATQIISGQFKCGTAPKSSGIVPVKGTESERRYSGFSSYMYYFYGLNSPKGLTPGLKPNQLVFADSGNHRVSVLDLSSGAVTWLAGSGNYPDTLNQGVATSQNIQHPNDVVYDQFGNLYISSEMGLIRKVNTLGQISVLAGNLSGTVMADRTSLDKLKLVNPHGLAFDNAKNYLYVADTNQNRVVRINLTSGEAITVAGNYQGGFSGDGGNALDASLSLPQEIALDDRGNLLIADVGNQRIRRVNFQNADGGMLRFSATSRDGSKLLRNSDGSWERVTKDGSKALFSNSGKQVAALNPQGLRTDFEYDEKGRLTQITFPTTQSISYSYSGDHIRSITDASGRTTTFAHNFKGQLAKVIFPDQSSKEFEYSSDGLLVKELDQLRQATSFEYNQYSRLAKVTRPGLPPVLVGDALTKTAINNSTDASPGNLDENAGKNPSSVITDANGQSTMFSETFDGLIAKITDADGKITEMQYDLLGRVVKIIKPNLKSNTLEYEGDSNRVVRSTDEETRKLVLKSYNARGQVTLEEVRSLDDPGYLKGVYRSFNANGELGSETNHLGIQTKYTYNSYGLPIRIEISKGALLKWEERDYDSYGNILKVRGSSGDETIFTYDLSGNRLSKKIKDTADITNYSLDAFNRLTKVTSPKNEITAYAYSERGELLNILDPKGQNTIFNYDALGRVISKTNSQGKSWLFEYDFNGNLVKETDPNQTVKSFEYSATNKLTRKLLPDDDLVIAYDLNNNVTGIENTKAAISFDYDSSQRVTQETITGKGPIHAWQVSRAYNIDDQQTAMSSTYYGTNVYAYTSLQQLSRITNFKDENFDVSYDDLGRLTRLTRLNMTTKFSFGVDQKLSSIEHYAGGVIQSSLSYLYNPSSLIQSISHSNGTMESYTYNENNFLASVFHTSSSNRQPASIGSVDHDEAFEYDSIGNRTRDALGSFNYDPTGQELKEDYKYRYVFDNNGNLIQRYDKISGAWASFGYSSENQLIEVKNYTELLGPSPFKTVSYVYDPLGRRIEKRVVDNSALSDPTKTFTRRYVYDGQEILSELDENNQILVRYTHSGLRTDDVLAVEITDAGVAKKLGQAAGSYSYLKDHLGSIREIADASGQIVQRNHYSAYGVLVSKTDVNDVELSNGPVVNTAFAFTGREYDQETGFYYYRARYYDPNTGRFLQVDPEPGRIYDPITVNQKYSYVGNLPTLFTDPSGKSSVLDDFLNFGHNFIADFGRAFDALVKSDGFKKLAILTLAFFGGYFLGPLIAGSLGLTGTMATVGSAIFGAGVGGFIGGAGYASQGLGSFQEGFTAGAVLGGIGGAVFATTGGMSPLNFANASAKFFNIPTIPAHVWKLGSLGSWLTGLSLVGGAFNLYEGIVTPTTCDSQEINGVPGGFTDPCKRK